MDLDAYRRSAETFVSELTGAFYRHYAGLEEDYTIEPIYERHAALFGAGPVAELQALHERAEGQDDRRLRMLLDFAVEGTLGQATKELEAELARREARATVSVDGETIGFREAAVVQANEAERARRLEVELALLSVTEEQLNPLYLELVQRQHAGARELGYQSYRDMCARNKGIDLAALGVQTEEFSAASAEMFADVLEPELRRTMDIGFHELRRADLPRFFRAVDQDPYFPPGRLIDSLLQTLSEMGIGAGDNVVLDVAPRPNKSPRAFCAPVHVPEEVYLVIAPVGGRDDFSALFHEAGHTEHFAHVEPRLPFEFRHLGDNSITEAFAFLFQHLVEDPAWLGRHLGVQDTDELASYARAHRLLYLRRYCGKLAYELELHEAEGALDGFAERYGELLGGALQIEWPKEMFLADVDPAFYCACYLRAWTLETHLRRYLRETFGREWFHSRRAGEALRELWREGQRVSPEELLDQLTGEALSFGVLLDDLALRR